MNNNTNNYDFVSEFSQGIAIVVKDSLYGAILMGGNEIITPGYDYISPFKDGYAQAIRKGKCIILDLSGRECKQYGGELIAIPAKYDYVRDFKNGYACVRLNGKWGAIDVNCKEIYEPQFYFLSDFVGGTAKYKMENKQYANSWGFLNTNGFRSECNLCEPEIEADGNLIIERYELSTNTDGSVYVDMVNNNPNRRVRINNKGQLVVKNGKSIVALPKEFLIAKNFENGLATVQDSTGYWGAVDKNGKIVIPLQYTRIRNFSENKAFATNKNGKLCLISTNGTIIKEFDTYSDGETFRGGYAIVTAGDKKGLINSSGKEILSPLDGYIYHTTNPDVFEISSSIWGNKSGLFMANTGLLIKHKFNKIIEIKKDHFKVKVDRQIGECLIDLSGFVFVEKDGKRTTFPGWCEGVKYLKDNIFIGRADDGRWGLLDGTGETIFKPTFDNIGELDNGFYKITSNGLMGVISGEGNIVLKPEWKQVFLSDGYYVVSKIIVVDYSKSERYGLVDFEGKVILETKYKAISILRKGLYKVKETNSWSIFNNEGKLTNETFDDVYMEDNYIAVSKNGLNGWLNDHGEKVIKSDDGNFINLPSKFTCGGDFKDGIAKVFVNGYENLVDKYFNIVIRNENQIIKIGKNIDYLVSKDKNGNYLFVSENKYGLINHIGEILIEAKYLYLSPLAGELYIAGIKKNDYGYLTYGVIDTNNKVVLSLEYYNIKPFGGKIPRSHWGHVTEQVETPEEAQHWYIQKNGYGLIDRNGNVCIQPIYEDIQKIDRCFLVKENNKYGLMSSEYNIVCNPKYSSIVSIGNGLWKVSIVTSQTSKNKSELFGIIDSDGKERLEPIYQFIGDVNDEQVAKGIAVINLKGKLGLVDENYCILADPQNKHNEHISDLFGWGLDFQTIISKEIDKNGVLSDIAESTNSEINKSKVDESAKVITIKTLKNGFVIVQKKASSPIYQYCAILDKDKNIILPYKYHRIEEQANGMFLVYRYTEYGGSYCGLLNENFQEVVAPKYENIRQIQDVFAVKNRAMGKSYTGLINSKGETILPCEYSSIVFAFPGLVWISKDNGESVGLASIEGEILLEPTYGKVGAFKNGYATVNNGHWYDDEEEDDDPHHSSRKFSMGKWGVINAKGQLILSPIYESINIEEDSCFSVIKSILIQQHNGNPPYKQVSGRYNKDGEQIVRDSHNEYILASKKYDWQEDFNAEGQSKVYYKGNIGVVNEKFQQLVSCCIEGKTLEFVLPEEYDWGYDSVFQFVIIEKNNKKGIIDYTKKIIIEPVYDQISTLSDSTNLLFKCGVQNENHNSYRPSYMWSIINVDGKPIIDIQSEEIIHLGFSLLAIKSNNKYSIVDFNGHSTCETSFDAVQSFGVSSSASNIYSWETPKRVDGLIYAIVRLEGKIGVIDNKGRLTIEPKYSSLSIRNNNQFMADGMLINAFEQKIVVKDNTVLTIPEDYDKMAFLDNGLLLVLKNELFGCINQIGCVIIPPKYKSLIYQNNLLIALLHDETDGEYKRGVVDFQENQIVPFSQQIKEIKIESEFILYKQGSHWGAYTLQGQVICEPIYDHIVYITHNLIKVGMDGKDYEVYEDYYWEDGERYDFTDCSEYSIINWGLIDNSGNEILPLEYRAIADKVVGGLVEIRSKNRIGYVDITGRILLEPTYKSVEPFIEGYAVVSKASSYYDEYGREREKSVYGVIDCRFKEIIPCTFDSIEYEKESGRFKTDVGYKTIDGRYVAEVDGKELLLNKKYKYCKPFSDTCAIAVLISEGQVKYYGLIDKRSNDILPPIFSRLDCVENELYKFKINNLYGLVNSKGNIILQNVYHGIGKFEDNLAWVQVDVSSDDRYDKQKLYGYVDSMGNEILPPTYEFIGKRSNKYAVVMKNNLWGLFSFENHKLNIITNAAYLGPCKDNLCRINVGGVFDKKNKKTTGGLWGYASVDGQIVIEPTYNQAHGFSEGMAAVKLNNKWGFINTEGIIVVPCEYDEVEADFENGKGELVKEGEIFVFDHNGSQIETYKQQRDDDDYYDEGYGDTPSIYDNPYYNDNLDMDQQSSEFWNSL